MRISPKLSLYIHNISIIAIAMISFSGCTNMKLAEAPFESHGPLSRIRPLKVRIVIPAVQGKQDTNINAQESWTKLFALTLAANGHEVAVGGPLPADMNDMSSAMDVDPSKIYPDNGQSDLTIELKGYNLEVFALDFSYGEFLTQSTITVDTRLTNNPDGIVRNYIGYSVGYTNDLTQSQQWCIWDYTRDPEIMAVFTRAAANK